MVLRLPAMRLDPLIIGAGPAGCAAAITLARAGHRPVLIERSTGPTDKVCGDFLGVDTVAHARALGCDPARFGAVGINRVRLIHGTHEAEARLPFEALSLSRRTFDQALLDHAERSGAQLLAGRTVRRLHRDGNAWVAEADVPVRSDAVFLASGKHDLREHPRPETSHGAIGMKMYFALSDAASGSLSDATELTLFPGGYAGLQPVENGRAALCIAVSRTGLQRHGGSWERLLDAIRGMSPRFTHMLMGARALLPRPLAVAGVPYGFLRSGGEDGLFRLGDQAAVIPSLTGDGMAIALHSGQAAANAWLSGADSHAYHSTLKRRLHGQMRLATMLHHACMSGRLQPAAVLAAGLVPAVLRYAATFTRIRGFRPDRLGLPPTPRRSEETSIRRSVS